jgi:hypothetical protein
MTWSCILVDIEGHEPFNRPHGLDFSVGGSGCNHHSVRLAFRGQPVLPRTSALWSTVRLAQILHPGKTSIEAAFHPRITIRFPMKKIPLFAMIIALAGCATIGSSSKISYTPEVRHESFASDRLFHDLLSAVGGVEAADEAAFPDAKERTLVRIEVPLRYDNLKTGCERWTIRHDANSTAVYQINLVPDGEGSTDFSVRKVQ